ncbi:MAG: S1C family serine protease [bacterium]|nr:S1C family serine protease [bacterium]
MQMHDLNNTQLILLALLVSFVTSIATGIVTVTLLDQAPPAVTQTINRIVERTVEVVTPSKTPPTTVTKTIVVKEEEFITKAAEKNALQVVEVGRLKKRFRAVGVTKSPAEEFELEIFGTAFVLNKDFVISQNRVLGDTEGLVIKSANNHFYNIRIAGQDSAHNIMLFSIGEQIKSAEGIIVNAESIGLFPSAVFADANKIQIGQTAIALGVYDGVLLSLGVVSQVKTKEKVVKEGDEETIKEVVSIHTTIAIEKRYSGGPLININGELMGINIVNESGEQLTVPINVVKTLVEQQSLPKESR